MPNLKEAICLNEEAQRSLAANPSSNASTHSEENVVAVAAAAAAAMMNLNNLPKELIDAIAFYLGYTDQVSLARTHPDLRFVMPRTEVIVGPDFAPFKWRLHPETHVEVPIHSRGLIEVWMSFQWRNDGYRAAKVWCQLIRAGRVIADERRQTPVLNSYRDVTIYGSYTSYFGRFYTFDSVLTQHHPIVKMAKKGDVLRVMRHVGGGGGHCLNIRDFNMTLVHKHD